MPFQIIKIATKAIKDFLAENEKYDIFEINEALFAFEQQLPGRDYFTTQLFYRCRPVEIRL